MAPKPMSKAKASTSQARPREMSSGDATSQDASQDLSQGIDIQTMQARMKEYKQQVKQRRAAQRQSIMSEHKQNIKDIQRDLKACNERYDKEWRNIQRPKVERLLSLIRRKEDLEAQIEACVEQTEQGFYALAVQLETVLAARAERISSPSFSA